MIKNLTKILIAIFILTLTNCEAIREKPVSKNKVTSAKPTYGSSNLELTTHNQFVSKEMETPKINKKKIQVALFLPFSGKNKELGWHLFNAATMSLFENDLNNNIDLILIDSKDSEEDTKKAFKEIVDRKIKIVIGPVFSQKIELIESEAKKNGIIVISPSNNQELAGKLDDDGGVFLAGFLPETQMDKIVTYSMSKGKMNFVIIAPQNQYGITINTVLKKIVKSRDGNLITSEFYDPNNINSLDKATENALKAFVVSPRFIRNKSKKPVAISEADRSYAQIIMIPESGKNLSKAIEAVKRLNKEERDFQIIGTSQWDDLSTLNDYNLKGAWFPAPENEKFRNFEKNYYQYYNKFPPRISSIIYDSLAAISELTNQKQGQAPTLLDLTSYVGQKNGFSGIDGPFRFLPNGLVQRNLAVLEVGNGKFETIDKPIEKFLRY